MQYTLDHDHIPHFCAAIQALQHEQWMMAIYHQTSLTSRWSFVSCLPQPAQEPTSISFAQVPSHTSHPTPVLAIPLQSRPWLLPIAPTTRIRIHHTHLFCSWQHPDGSATACVCYPMSHAIHPLTQHPWQAPLHRTSGKTIARFVAPWWLPTRWTCIVLRQSREQAMMDTPIVLHNTLLLDLAWIQYDGEQAVTVNTSIGSWVWNAKNPPLMMGHTYGYGWTWYAEDAYMQCLLVAS